jgi:Domain of unknown function (DUF4157)
LPAAPAHREETSRVRGLLDLQASAGNAAVTRLVSQLAAVQRSSDGTGRPVAAGPARILDELGPGVALPAMMAREFGAAYGSSLDAVRMHVDSPVPQQHGARALTVGSHVAFAPGRFQPNTATGRELIGHELAHVVQQQGGASGGPAADAHETEADAAARAAVAGAPAGRLSPVGGQAAQGDDGPMSLPPEEQVCRAPTDTGQAPASLLAQTGTADERAVAFKSLVTNVAAQRLTANRGNLAKWSQLIESVIPSGDLAAMGLAQSGGTSAYLEMQDIHDPMMRELRATQAIGHNRACTGCHLANYAWGTRADRAALGGREWMSPNEQRASPFGPGYLPTPGGAEARLGQLFPDPNATMASMQRVRPILDALGPQGYGVLPASILMDLERGSIEALRTHVRDAISERSQGYADLITRIQSGGMGYEHFGPIIRDLLPSADPEVRALIQEEMDSNAFWAKAEAIALGILSVAALLLAIFPPTSAAGIAGLGALEMTLGVYGGVKGAEMIDVGTAYAQGFGADDVFARQQQEAGGMMALSGFFSVVLAPLAVAGGASRMASVIGPAELGLTAGQAVQRGGYLLTLHEDGSIVATMAERPDVLIILRGDTATAYQVTGTGLRVLETRPLASVAGAGAESSPLMSLPPGASGAGDMSLLPGPESPLLLPAPSVATPLLLPDEAAAANAAQRAYEVAHMGGALPQETRAVGAAIIDVEGWKGPTAIRAISGAETDALGAGAPVPHALTPTDRTLSASRMIGGTGGGAPVSHINDAEIKLYEMLRRSGLPRDARGTIYVATWRSRMGGAEFEPLPMCASCTNASFQMKGDFPNITFVALTPPRGVQRVIDLEAAGLCSLPETTP